MITKIANNLFIADIDGCKRINNSDAIIHACKNPCYEKVMGKNVSKTDKNYLFYEEGKDLFLNIIDTDRPLFYKQTFDKALEFIKENIQDRKLIIHCNQCQSRSPSIAMLYLFKDLTYHEAQNKMIEIYDWYAPNIGIDYYLKYNWGSFKK